MRGNARTGWTLTCAALAWWIGNVAPVEGDVPAADGAPTLATFVAEEVLGARWPRTLVQYQVTFEPGEAKPERLRLLDEANEPVTFQLTDVTSHADGTIASARVWFHTDLPPQGSYRYRLVAGEAHAPTEPGPQVHRDDASLMLDNGVTAMRLPAEGVHRHADAPLRFAPSDRPLPRPTEAREQGLIPGPIGGVRLADGRWTAGSGFHADDPERWPGVTQYACQVLEQGPLFVEAEVRYDFADQSWYRLRVRLLRDDPAIRLIEEADFQHTGDPREPRVTFSLSGDAGEDQPWRATHVYWHTPEGRLAAHDEALYAAFAEHGFETEKFHRRDFGSRSIREGIGTLSLDPWHPWDAIAHYVGLVDLDALASQPLDRVPFLAVVPMHAGSWRGAHDVHETWTITDTADGGLVLDARLRVPPHPQSILHTGEYDPQLPFTYVRRVWSLVAGPIQWHDTVWRLRKYDGYITLDDYKNWVVNWPDAAVDHPRIIFNRSLLERLRGQLEEHPEGEALAELLFFHSDPDRLETLWKQNTGPRTEWSGVRGQALAALTLRRDFRYPMHWQSSFRQGQAAHWVGAVDEMLASGMLSDEQRRQLRAWIAADVYALSHPDFNPRGSMTTLGPVNMAMNRFAGVPLAAALIPDHPMAAHWLDVSADYLDYFFASRVAPGGAWSEVVTYYHAGATHLMQAGLALELSGRLNPDSRQLIGDTARYMLQLLTPMDPRFNSRRVPCWGHEGSWINTHWLVAAAVVRDQDPRLAEALAWAWDQLGRPDDAHHDARFSPYLIAHADLLARREARGEAGPPEALRSVWLPGFGAVLRAHAGDPNETYLSLRQGYAHSHSDANQGDFVLHARGAPLSDMSLCLYALYNDRPFDKLGREFGWHNRVRFGEQTDNGGWPGGGGMSHVHRYHFSDSVDYLRALGDYPPQRWTRQVMLLKARQAGGPDYFLFRDSFQPLGDEPIERTWWYLRTPGDTSHLQHEAQRLIHQSPWAEASLEAHFFTEAPIAVESRQATQQGPMYFQAAANWREAGSPVIESQHNHLKFEETMTVTAVGPFDPGHDIVVALLPRDETIARPTYRRLGEGALQVITSEGTDYLFVDDDRVRYEDEQMAFEGEAGAIRVYDDQVHLAVLEGPGRVRYGSVTLEAAQPAVRIVARDEAERGRARTLRVGEVETTITFELDPADGPIEQVSPGVRYQQRDNGFAYAFDSEQRIEFERDEVVFHGRRGGVEVNHDTGTARLVMLDGRRPTKVTYRGVGAGFPRGPYEVVTHADRLTLRADGPGRMLFAYPPAGLNRAPVLMVDGRPHMPGRAEGSFVVPLMPDRHSYELKALPQPPLWQPAPIAEGQPVPPQASDPDPSINP